jgi:hypothetical protein
VQSLLLGRKHVPHKPVPGFLLDQKARSMSSQALLLVDRPGQQMPVARILVPAMILLAHVTSPTKKDAAARFRKAQAHNPV